MNKKPFQTVRRGVGRPKKFAGPSRAITITLPEQVLTQLDLVDADRGRAIEKVTRSYVEGANVKRPLVEIIELAPGVGLLVLGPCRRLEAIPSIRSIEISPGRFLMMIVPGTPPESIEVEIADLLEAAESSPEEKKILKCLLVHIRNLRRARRLEKAELLITSIPRQGTEEGA